MSTIDNIYESMEKKARKDKDYHMEVWKSHIQELCKLTGHREGEMSWERYEELNTELMGYAEARWISPS